MFGEIGNGTPMRLAVRLDASQSERRPHSFLQIYTVVNLYKALIINNLVDRFLNNYFYKIFLKSEYIFHKFNFKVSKKICENLRYVVSASSACHILSLSTSCKKHSLSSSFSSLKWLFLRILRLMSK